MCFTRSLWSSCSSLSASCSTGPPGCPGFGISSGPVLLVCIQLYTLLCHAFVCESVYVQTHTSVCVVPLSLSASQLVPLHVFSLCDQYVFFHLEANVDCQVDVS